MIAGELPAVALDEQPAPRPALTTPATVQLLDTAEAALGQMASELGCVWNDRIPHNAGWFVPGQATAYGSAYDAIKGLVESLRAGGTVYTPKDAPAIAASRVQELPIEGAQGGLF